MQMTMQTQMEMRRKKRQLLYKMIRSTITMYVQLMCAMCNGFVTIVFVLGHGFVLQLTPDDCIVVFVALTMHSNGVRSPLVCGCVWMMAKWIQSTISINAQSMPTKTNRISIAFGCVGAV